MKLRENNISKLNDPIYDALVIGGGINGAVSAAALSGKGAKVALIDKGDFAGCTSQESSNLAWGGIKYMESLDFPLVWKLCKSRNHLIRNYPSTVLEIRFFTTIAKGFRFPFIFIWLGTWLYWFFGRCFTKPPRLLFKKDISEEESVVNLANASGGFEYSDAYLYDNDARFVFSFIRSALNSGCTAANYVESKGSRKENGIWITKAKDVVSGKTFEIKSKVLINAAGPFVDDHNHLNSQKTAHRHVLSKGIHLIVNQITPNKRVLAFFASDGRLFFVIPMGSKTCIGTTDTPVEEPCVQVTEEERGFVLDNINKMLDLKPPLTRKDIIAERCGVRPLVVNSDSSSKQTTDFLQLSRKHVVEANEKDSHISIYGGKLTDCLNVGDEVSEIINRWGVGNLPYFGDKWYGEPPQAVKDEFMHQAKLMNLDGYTSPESSENLSTRLWRRYGFQAFEMLENIREDPRQSEVLIKGTEYIRCELYQAAHKEMITKLEDFLRRRSKIAMVETRETIKNSPGIMEACEILFGKEAQQKFDEYFN